MVGNSFAYISRMGQIESSHIKFIINLFMKEKILKFMKSLLNLFLYMGKKIPKLFPCHKLVELLI